MSQKKRKIFPTSAAGMEQVGARYYPNTEVRTTDPFLVLKCPLCGWTCWSTHWEAVPCQQCAGMMRLDVR